MAKRKFVGAYFLDRRIKVLPCQVERLRRLKDQGWSYAEMADVFNISKSQAYYALNPKARKKKEKRYRELAKDGRYYVKERDTKRKQKTRLKDQHIKCFFNQQNNNKVETNTTGPGHEEESKVASADQQGKNSTDGNAAEQKTEETEETTPDTEGDKKDA
jgi:hypothetical protein